MASDRPTHPRYCCRVCRRILPAWLPVQRGPDGPMLLGHLAQFHPEMVKPWLADMHETADVTTVSLQGHEVVEGESAC